MAGPAQPALRIFVLGGPGYLTACALHRLLDDGHRLVAFWSALPDRQWRRDRRRRWYRPAFSTSSALRRAGVVEQSLARGRSWAELVAEIGRLQPDILLSIGFSRRIRADALALLPGRCVNLHPALLPAYRGPTPSWAMVVDGRLASDGGATLHVVDADFDTGPIIAARPAPPEAWRNPFGHVLAVAREGAILLAENLPRYLAGDIAPVPQDPSRALHRRVDRADLTIRPEMDCATVARIAGVIPWLARPRVLVAGRMLAVDGLSAAWPRQGARPPRVRWWSVEMDIADARVRLARQTPWRKWARAARKFLILLRA